MEAVSSRKKYLDNIRWMTVCTVVLFHITGMYSIENTVVSNYQPGGGHSAAGAFCYFVYPWFMLLLFIVSGISARYYLQKHSLSEFLRGRRDKLLPAFFGGLFLLGWVGGWATDRQNQIFTGMGIQPPGPIKYLIYCLIGMGPLWFVLELFLGSAALALILKLDRRRRLPAWGEKRALPTLLLLALPVWGASFVLNTPVVVSFRNGFYWLGLFLGYFVLAGDAVLETLKRRSVLLSVGALLLGAAYMRLYWGTDFAGDACLQSPLTNAYAWLTCLAALGTAQKFLDFSGRLTEFMRERSYHLYLLHYPIMILAAMALREWMDLPVGLEYVLTGVCSFGVPLLLPGAVRKIKALFPSAGKRG